MNDPASLVVNALHQAMQNIKPDLTDYREGRIKELETGIADFIMYVCQTCGVGEGAAFWSQVRDLAEVGGFDYEAYREAGFDPEDV